MPQIDWIKNLLFGTPRRNGKKHHGTRPRRKSTLLALLELENRTLLSLAVTSLFTSSSPVTITLGPHRTTLTDSATLYGGNNPTGTLDFTLISVTSDKVVDTETVAVHGDGTYSTSPGYTLPTKEPVSGTYEWSVHYSGDGKNDAADGHSTSYGQDQNGNNPTLETLVNFDGTDGIGLTSALIEDMPGISLAQRLTAGPTTMERSSR